MEIMYKMVFLLLILVITLSHCHPRNKLPRYRVSPPQDINSLEIIDVEESRSIANPYSQNKIQDAIKEVEDAIRRNPHLPRLTRGEILDLIENITKEDQNNKNRGGKNLMVVMPYTANKDDKNMAELFTKQPVTHFIGGEPFRINTLDDNKYKKQKPMSTKYNLNDKKTTPITRTTFTTTTTTSTTVKPTRNRRRRITTTMATTIIPEIFVTTYHPVRSRPMRRRTTRPTTTTTSLPVEATKYPNHRYPDEEVTKTVYESNNGGMRVIGPPKLAGQFSGSFINSQNYDVLDTHNDSVIPHNLQKVFDDLNLESAIRKQEEEKVQTPSPEDKDRLRQLLASLGVVTESTTTVKTTTTPPSNKIPDVGNVAESLSPEMRDLLMSFGLLPDPNIKPHTEATTGHYYPEKAVISPDSYVGFKPLPSDEANREDMNALLAAFGLGRNARNQKSVKTPRKPKEDVNDQYNFDMIPQNLKGVLADLGLSPSSRQEKRIESSNTTRNSIHQSTTHSETHVFNPDEQHASKDELEKLEQLMNVIKELEKLNGTATDEDLKKIDFENIKQLTESLSQVTLEDQEKESPDPNLNVDEILSKNEVKRQTSTTSTAISATTPASTTIAITETKDDGPSLSDLEDSFGGQSSTTTTTEIPESTTRKTGAYYLFDWNSFLDIDNQAGRRVNLRLQPKVGDPKNFISVTVP